MKTIADPLYGSIQLTDIEHDIIRTHTFQRLHNVKQLGQANLIFPGANYSRFSHSIGALRNAGKLLQALKKNNGELQKQIESVEEKYRLAALMHDIGHFPFSHAAEVALKQLKKEMTNESYRGDRFEVISNHELFGELIIMNSPEIAEILERKGLDPDKVSAVFARNNTGINSDGIDLKPIISSELDCDRLDYLKRTSHFTGLPYGNVDIDYLISSVKILNGKICFSSKATKSIDHMLLARFHDYQQVVFHKRLIPLEWSLVECIKEAARESRLYVSKTELLERICSGEIRSFDDNEVLYAIKAIEEEYKRPHKRDSAIAFHIKAVLYGVPAEQIFSAQEYIDGSSLAIHEATKINVEEIVSQYCDANGIGSEYVYVWSSEHFISKASPSTLARDGVEGIENIDELVYIEENSFYGEPVPLIELPDSITGILARKYLSDVRVFILPIDGYQAHVEKLKALIVDFYKSTVIDRTPS